MVNQASGSTQRPASRGQSWLTPHCMVLTIMWVITSVAIVMMLLYDVQDAQWYQVALYVLFGGYVAALLWYLVRKGPSVKQLPELRAVLLPRRRYGPWIPVLGIAFLLVLTAIADDGVDIVRLLMILATFWVLVAWRREIRLYLIIQGLAVALIAGLGGLPFLYHGALGATVFYLILILVPLMYVAGGLLVTRTGLGGVQLLRKRYLGALQSVFWGCLLFVPIGLINVADGLPDSNLTSVSKWWMPFTLPWFSGIVEEVLFRLLLVGLCYYLLRPAFRTRPALAILAAVLFSAITFGLGHGRTLDKLLTTGLLYGLSMAVIFARRDFEHAVGAHYMINMPSWVVVFLQS